MKETNVTFTEDELAELYHLSVMGYMDYEENLFHDQVLQEEYKLGVYKYNKTIDNIRIKLKEALKKVD